MQYFNLSDDFLIYSSPYSNRRGFYNKVLVEIGSRCFEFFTDNFVINSHSSICKVCVSYRNNQCEIQFLDSDYNACYIIPFGARSKVNRPVLSNLIACLSED